LEVWLIGRDDNFVGQFLVVLEIKKRNTKKRKEKYSVKWIADERECEEKYRRRNEELTSGTMKLIAILQRGGSLRAPGLVRKSLCRRTWRF
jgi:hypothetical protein